MGENLKNISRVFRKIMLFGVFGIILVGGAGYRQGRVVGAETEEENTSEVIQSGKYDYRVLEDGTVELLKYHGSYEGMGTVPNLIDGKKVTVLGNELYLGFGNLSVIRIPEGIATLKNEVFAYNASLEKVIFPTTINSIGSATFASCKALEKIVMPDGLKEISNELFDYCKNLKEVIVPDGIEKVGTLAFRGTDVYKMVFGKKILKIEELAFDKCSNLKSVILLNPKTELPTNVFPDNTIIYGFKDSTAELYANYNGNQFIEFEPIQRIKLSTNQISLIKGKKDSQVLDVTLLPISTQYQKLQWLSSNEDVAKVDVYGNITAVGNGTVTITVKALAESEAKATCTVKVSTKANGIYFQTTSLNLDLGKMNGNTTKLIPSFYPKTANYVEKIEWWTPDTEIVKVDQTGQVTALKNGTATVYAKISEDSWIGTAECKVRVSTSVNRINLNKTSVELVKGRPGEESIVLTANALPMTANNRSISWSSSNENVLVVDKAGKVTVKATGTAYIVAKALDGSNTQGKCKVTVRPKVAGIRLDKSYIHLDLTQYKTSTVKIKEVSPDPYTRYIATWSSSNPKVATVSSKGTITAKSSGKTAITVTVDGTKKSVTVVVTPGKVPSFQVKSRTTSSITLTWKKTKEAQGYLIYRAKANTKKYRAIGQCSANTTKYTDKGLSSGKVYQYRIVPVFNLKSEQLKGPYVAIKTATRPKATSIVMLNSVANKTTKGIRISWERVIGASGYEIYMSTKATTGYKKVGTTKGNNACSYTKMDLKKGKKYYFKVRAYIVVKDKKIYGTYSKERNVKR